MLSAGVPRKSRRVDALRDLSAAHLVESYTDAAPRQAEHRGGLPIGQLRRVENCVQTHLAEGICTEVLVIFRRKRGHGKLG
jgi:hypothetical protein